MIHWELCKKIKFHHTNKWGKYKPDCSRILRDFEIQMDHPLPTRRPDLVLSNKKKETCHLVDFVIPADHSEVTEGEKQDKYLDFTRGLKRCRT